MVVWSNIKACLQYYRSIEFIYSILRLGFLWCWLFHWSWMISVFLPCQFKLDTGLCGFCGQVSDLGWGWCVVCAGAMVPRSERPSLWAQRKLTRQAWVSQWQAPGRKLVWVHGRLSSCSCMTLTTATTRQAILLLLSEAMLLWVNACRPFRGTGENRVCILIDVGGSLHAWICACNAATTCTCTCVWLYLCLPVDVCLCGSGLWSKCSTREERRLTPTVKETTHQLHTAYRITPYWNNELP